MKRTTVLDNQWVTIFEDQYQLPNGTDCTYYHADRLDAVMAIAIDTTKSELETFIVRQHRHPIGRSIWQFPLGGFNSKNAEPISVAREELRQETGIAADKFTLMDRFYTDPGFTNQQMYVCATHNIQRFSNPELEDTEYGLKCKRVRVADLDTLVSSGEMGDAWGIAGLHYVKRYLSQQQLG